MNPGGAELDDHFMQSNMLPLDRLGDDDHARRRAGAAAALPAPADDKEPDGDEPKDGAAGRRPGARAAARRPGRGAAAGLPRRRRPRPAQGGPRRRQGREAPEGRPGRVRRWAAEFYSEQRGFMVEALTPPVQAIAVDRRARPRRRAGRRRPRGLRPRPRRRSHAACVASARRRRCCREHRREPRRPGDRPRDRFHAREKPMKPHSRQCFANHLANHWADRADLGRAHARRDQARTACGGARLRGRRSAAAKATTRWTRCASTAGGVAVVSIDGPMSKFDSSLGGCNTVRTRQAMRAAARTDDRVDRPAPTARAARSTGRRSWPTTSPRPTKVKPVLALLRGHLPRPRRCGSLAQARKVYANATALIGSIGCYMVLVDSSKAYEAAGLKTHVISSGGMKGLGADGTPITDEQKSPTAEHHRRAHEVLRRRGRRRPRHVARPRSNALADGRVHVAAERAEARPDRRGQDVRRGLLRSGRDAARIARPQPHVGGARRHRSRREERLSARGAPRLSKDLPGSSCRLSRPRLSTSARPGIARARSRAAQSARRLCANAPQRRRA
jgi:hypothetical protein